MRGNLDVVRPGDDTVVIHVTLRHHEPSAGNARGPRRHAELAHPNVEVMTMMRSVAIPAAAAAAAAVTALAGALALPSTSGAVSAPGQAVIRLTLVETTDTFHLIDAPAPAADGEAGDTAIFESTLRTTTGIKRGSLEGHCLQIRADGSLDDCDVTVTVGARTFRMSGPFDPTTGGTLTITGGTRSWIGAGGTDTIANQPNGTAIHTIALVRP